MTEIHEPEPRASSLEELFVMATRRASTVMSQWTHGSVKLRLGPVEEIAPEEAVNRLDLGDELLTFANIHVAGSPSGQLMLAFDDDNVRRLTQALLGNRPAESLSEELRESVLKETANILGSAYLAVLSDATDVLLLPSPPSLVCDYGACVLQLAIVEHMLTSDRLLLLPIEFEDASSHLSWQVFFVPSPELMQLIKANLGPTS